MPLVMPSPETEPVQEQPRAQPGPPTQVGPPAQPQAPPGPPGAPTRPSGGLVLPGAPPGPAGPPTGAPTGAPPTQDPSLLSKAWTWVKDSPWSPAYIAGGTLYYMTEAMGYPSKLIENGITGAQGYENFYKQAYPQLDPKAVVALSTASRLALDPSNLLFFSGLTAKAVGTAVDLAGHVGLAAAKLGEGLGLEKPLATALGTLERAGLEGKLTPALVQKVLEPAGKVARSFAKVVDLFAEVPEARAAFHAYDGAKGLAAGEGILAAHEVRGMVATPADRILMTHLLQETDIGKQVANLSKLPDYLKQAYIALRRMRDADGLAVKTKGIADELVNGYMYGLYKPEDASKIIDAMVRQVGKKGMAMADHIKIFNDVAAAKEAGLNPWEDASVLIGARRQALKLAEGKIDLFEKLIKIPGHARLTDELEGFASVASGVHPGPGAWLAEPGERWHKITEFLGAGVVERKGWEGIEFSPELTRLLNTSLHGERMGELTRIFGGATAALKRLIFFNPLFHGQNIEGSAYLALGGAGRLAPGAPVASKLFSPKNFMEYRQLVADAYEMGPWTRRFLAHEGWGTGSAQELRKGVEGIIGDTLGKEGIDIRKPTQWGKYLKEMNDEILWNQLDRGTRLQVFKHFVGLGLEDKDAARMSNLFMNNYSQSMLSQSERTLQKFLFTYTWQKGRAQLFANMAKSWIPNAIDNPIERQILRQATIRWAAAQTVIPRMIRGMLGEGTNYMISGRIPIAEDAQGKKIYAKFGGFYNDVADFFTNPTLFGEARLNPFIKTGLALHDANKDAWRDGRSGYEVLSKGIKDGVKPYLPSVLPQMTKAWPTWTKILPWLGEPVSTTPPAEMDPHKKIHQALIQGNLGEAIGIAHQHRLAIEPFMNGLPPEQARRFRLIMKFYPIR